MSDQDLELLVSLAVRELPGEHAPETLLPRVLAAVAARQQRAWYARPAATWSPVRQVSIVTASLIALVVLLAYAPLAPFAATSSRLPGVHTGLGTTIVHGLRDAASAASATASFAGRAARIWLEYCAPLAIYASVLIVLLGGALTAFATALGHLSQTRSLSR